MRLRLHKDSDDTFKMMADHLAGVLYRLGLTDGDAVLDVGCGVGRLPIGLLRTTSFHGRYVGFDVSAKHLRWARRTLRPLAPNFRFRRVDVQNDRYNPAGKLTGDSIRFPVRANAFDVACLFSGLHPLRGRRHRELPPRAAPRHASRRHGGGHVVPVAGVAPSRRRDRQVPDGAPARRARSVRRRGEATVRHRPPRRQDAGRHRRRRPGGRADRARHVGPRTGSGGAGLVVLRKPVPPPPSLVRRVRNKAARTVRRAARARSRP